MFEHEYTARDALLMLISGIERKSDTLARRIRVAIDAGKDVEVDGTSSIPRGRPRGGRSYRKSTPYSDVESLAVAMDVLDAHLVESRKCVASVLSEFKRAGWANPESTKGLTFEDEIARAISGERSLDVYGVGEPKEVVLESEPETVHEKTRKSDIRLSSVDLDGIVELQGVVQKLRSLLEFKENSRGYAS